MAINPLSFADLEGNNASDSFRNNIGGAAGTGASNTQQISSGAGGSFGGASGVGGSNSGSSAGGQASAGSKPSTSGSFVNLQSYLNANQDQARGLGDKISSGINNEANQGFSSLGNVAGQFKSDIDSNNNNINKFNSSEVPSAFSDIINNPKSLNSTYTKDITGVENQAVGAGAKANAPISDSSTLNLAGPKNLTGYQDYNTSINKLQNAANDAANTESESGRQQLLQQNYAAPNYSSGQQQLDQLLLQGNPQNQSTFQNLQNQLLGPNASTNPNQLAQNSDYTTYTGPSYSIQGQEANAQKQAADYLSHSKQNLANNYNLTQSYINGNGGTSPLTVGVPAGSAVNSRPSNVDISKGGLNAYLGNIAQGDVAKAQAAQDLAVQKEQQAAQTQFVNHAPGNFISPDTLRTIFNSAVSNDTGKAGIVNSIDPDTYARLQALNNLAQVNPNTVDINGTPTIITPSSTPFTEKFGFNPSEANTAAQRNYGFTFKDPNGGNNNTASNPAYAAAQKQYNQNLAQLQAYINGFKYNAPTVPVSQTGTSNTTPPTAAPPGFFKA